MRNFNKRHVVDELQAALNLVEPEGFRLPMESNRDCALRILGSRGQPLGQFRHCDDSQLAGYLTQIERKD